MGATISPTFSFWNRRKLPTLMQTEAAECGLVCLAMIAGYWGHRIDVAGARRRCSVSIKGTTLKSLMNLARELGLQARPLKLQLEGLHELTLPCILHWDMNHFVVLKELKRDRVLIVDPAIGERRFSYSELSRHFTGVALELTPGADFKPLEDYRPITWNALIGKVTGISRGLSQLILLGVALQICAMVAPFYLQWVVDEALVSADRNLITVLGIGFLLLVLIQTTISAIRAWAITTLTTSLNFQWLGNVFGHLMKLPMPYFETRHLGDIVSRFSSIQTIQRGLTTQFVEGTIDGIMVLGTLTIMLIYSGKLSAIAMATVSVYVLIRWILFKSLRDANTEQITHAAKQQTHFIESVRGVQTVKLFNKSEERRIGWMNHLADQFNSELRVARLSISYQSASALLFSSERVVIIWLAGLIVINGQFSVGMLFAFISYKEQFSQRVCALIDKVFELRMLRIHGERLADIVLTKTENDASIGEIEPDRIIPSFEVRRLAFRYSDVEPYVLKDLNLTIPAGQFVAITGASGCGKTTLIKLLLGLLEPTEGEILVGGVKLSHLGLTNYRQIVGTVMQDDQLFSGSISENITFFDPNPNRERIETSAKLAAIHDDVSIMPMGYNTLVSGIGTGLSGGQKQRVLLARSLYSKPRILILDEATSHLDVGNERLVNASIAHCDLTRIVVAHRPDTIALAQRVLVLEGGKLVSDSEQLQVSSTMGRTLAPTENCI